MDKITRFFELAIISLCVLIGCILVLILAGYCIFWMMDTIPTRFIVPLDQMYAYTVLLIPYLIFFAAWYYLQKKIRQAKKPGSKVVAWILFYTGSLTCLVSLIIASLKFFRVRIEWLDFINDNAPYALIIQLLFIFFTAAAIATGDPKEKSWIERRNRDVSTN